ncbi:MAG: efflux transporter outer membrane subunit [Woeseiaceae bacterium]
MSRLSLRLVAILVTATLVGCSVGPEYVAPAWEQDVEWRSRIVVEEGAAADWWRDGGDPILDELIARALTENKDIRMAKGRIAEAVAGQQSARGARLPSVVADARYTAFEQSIESPQTAGPLIDAGIIPRDGEFYATTLQASWEIDLFGLRGRQIAAADARAAARLAEGEAVVLQIVAETIIAYADWRSFSARADVATRNANLQRESKNVIDGKVRLGLARKLDGVRATTALARLEADIPVLAANAVAAKQRLAVLLGVMADAIDENLLANDVVIPPQISVGEKSSLLRRRPDVHVAERLLAVATEDQGAAAAAFFPQLTLTASGGFEAGELDRLTNGAARTTGIVPFVRWPIFQGNRLRAARAAADARQQQAMAEYEKTVLLAFADAESAIASQAGARQALASIVVAADAAREAEVLARRLYQQGLVDYLTLLDAQRQLAAIEDARIVTENQVILSAARLYKALGGGWTSPSR